MLNKPNKILSDKKNVDAIDDREILRRLGAVFGAHPDDVVRSLDRFKRERDEAKKLLGE